MSQSSHRAFREWFDRDPAGALEESYRRTLEWYERQIEIDRRMDSESGIEDMNKSQDNSMEDQKWD